MEYDPIIIDPQFAVLPETNEGYDATIYFYYSDGDVRQINTVIPSDFISWQFYDSETADHCVKAIYNPKAICKYVEEKLKIKDVEFTIEFHTAGKIVGEKTMFFQYK